MEVGGGGLELVLLNETSHETKRMMKDNKSTNGELKIYSTKT